MQSRQYLEQHDGNLPLNACGSSCKQQPEKMLTNIYIEAMMKMTKNKLNQGLLSYAGILFKKVQININK